MYSCTVRIRLLLGVVCVPGAVQGQTGAGLPTKVSVGGMDAERPCGISLCGEKKKGAIIGFSMPASRIRFVFDGFGIKHKAVEYQRE